MNRKIYALFGILMIFVFLVPVAANATGKEEQALDSAIRGKPGSTPLFCVITAPTDGVTVSGEVTITIDASGIPTITIGGTSVGKTYSYVWDTTLSPDGPTTIAASYRNAKDSITVVVDNGGGTPPPPPPPPGGDGVVKKYAVLVGINEYKAISGLDNCVNDVIDWDAYLSDKGYSITTFVDSQATEYAVKNALVDMVARADGDDQIIFVQSSHGYKLKKDQMLCMYDDYDGMYGEDGDIYDYELADIFAAAVAQTFIFFDVCYSGGMNEAVDVNSNIYMTTTCGPNGYGYDVPEYQNGAWTYWFLEQGLVGQGITEAQECFDWASPQYPWGGGSAPCEFGTIFFVF
jgi:hypothetical protein